MHHHLVFLPPSLPPSCTAIWDRLASTVQKTYSTVSKMNWTASDEAHLVPLVKDDEDDRHVVSRVSRLDRLVGQVLRGREDKRYKGKGNTLVQTHPVCNIAASSPGSISAHLRAPACRWWQKWRFLPLWRRRRGRRTPRGGTGLFHPQWSPGRNAFQWRAWEGSELGASSQVIGVWQCRVTATGWRSYLYVRLGDE